MDTKDIPNDARERDTTPPADQKFSPQGIAAMQGKELTVDDLQERVEQLRAETEAREGAERAALEVEAAEQASQPPEQAEPEAIATSGANPQVLADQPPAYKPGYAAETLPLAEGEPLDEKPAREGPAEPPEGWHPGGPEEGG